MHIQMGVCVVTIYPIIISKTIQIFKEWNLMEKKTKDLYIWLYILELKRFGVFAISLFLCGFVFVLKIIIDRLVI